MPEGERLCPDLFRATVYTGELAPGCQARTEAAQEPFLKGPIPLWWLAAAARLPGKALAVGIAIWYRAGRAKSDTVGGSWRLWAELGVDRSAMYRALRQLEAAGLIVVERSNGKNPVITLVRRPRG